MTQQRPAILEGVFAEETAFRDWYDAALPRVYAYLFNRCGRSQDLAEELAQQTFVEAVRQRTRFRGESDSVTWVIGIARHKLVDHLRRTSQDERRLEKLLRALPPTAQGDPALASVAGEDEMLERLGALPGSQRAALILAYVDELPVREVARVLGRSESAAESLLSRARVNYRRLHGMDRRD